MAQRKTILALVSLAGLMGSWSIFDALDGQTLQGTWTMKSPLPAVRAEAARRRHQIRELSNFSWMKKHQARVIAMLRSPTGITIAAIMKATGWQPHSVRGFLAGVVRKRLNLKLVSKKINGNRIYQIASEDSTKDSTRQDA